MENQGSATRRPEGYAPISKRRRTLFSIYCKDCGAASVCPEKDLDSACADPATYDPEDFHPARHPGLAKSPDWNFPATISQGPIYLPPAVLIAKEFVGSQNGRYAVHADRLTGRKFHPVDEGLAFLVGSDRDQKKFWDRRGDLGNRLRRAGFSLAVTPAFSTYSDSPPLDGHVAVKWTAQMVRDLSRQITVVPSIAWRTDRDLERSLEWFEAGGVHTVALHLSQSARRQWEWMLEAVETLARLSEGSLHLVVIGPSTIDRIQRVANAWPGSLTIASTKPWMLARRGRALRSDLSHYRVPKNKASKDQLFTHNAETFFATTESLLRYPQLRLVSGL